MLCKFFIQSNILTTVNVTEIGLLFSVVLNGTGTWMETIGEIGKTATVL